MILAIDAGNSRIKWGLWADRGFLAQGSVPIGRASDLAAAWEPLPRAQQAIGSNVAGEAARAGIEAVLAPWSVAPVWLRAVRAAHGVTNRYADPEQLGSDRWAALIGARARFTGACVVVVAGTAITVNALTAQGEFLGGLILPGLDLMAQALAGGTAGLELEPGEYAAFPTRTADAIASGAIQAACGAIERMQREMEAQGHAPLQVVLSGGGADILARRLVQPVALVPNLVLEGLVAAARA